MKRLVEIALGLFILHTVEESVSRFWDADPFAGVIANAVHIPAFWVYWIGQLILYAFLLSLMFLPYKKFRTWGSVLLAILMVLEMEHVVVALDFGYTLGLYTGAALSIYGVFYAVTLIRTHTGHIKIPLSEELKRKLMGFISLGALLYLVLWGGSFLPTHPRVPITASAETVSMYATTTKEVTEEVLPAKGFQTKIVLGNVVTTMVTDGIIDISKVEVLYKNSGGIPADEMKILTQPSNAPLVVSAANVPWLIDILWPLGLSNKMAINDSSPIAGKNVNNFASTGGWTLGKANSGGGYFNSYALMPLTPEQEQHIKTIAENTYRPCCDNSSFFQDCNHGSAALALIELGVAQGLSDTDIYKTLLDFNSFWFQKEYLETALYFKIIKHTDWNDVDPKLVLSKDYSSLSGWEKNVDTVVSQIPGLVPQAQSGGACGV